MYPWFNSWLNLFRAPLSGDVNQDYAPITSWWSPQFEFNFAGDQRVEADVVRGVASYGRQLGALTDAVLALGKDNDSPELKHLRDMADKIAAIKQHHSGESLQSLKSKLSDLKHSDQAAFQQLMAEVNADA